jgi:hypothetical protein
MKAGVSTTPCRVCNRPRRAFEDGSVLSSVNIKGGDSSDAPEQRNLSKRGGLALLSAVGWQAERTSWGFSAPRPRRQHVPE